MIGGVPQYSSYPGLQFLVLYIQTTLAIQRGVDQSAFSCLAVYTVGVFSRMAPPRAASSAACAAVLPCLIGATDADVPSAAGEYPGARLAPLRPWAAVTMSSGEGVSNRKGVITSAALATPSLLSWFAGAAAARDGGGMAVTLVAVPALPAWWGSHVKLRVSYCEGVQVRLGASLRDTLRALCSCSSSGDAGIDSLHVIDPLLP